jgi:hypothetical protein
VPALLLRGGAGPGATGCVAWCCLPKPDVIVAEPDLRCRHQGGGDPRDQGMPRQLLDLGIAGLPRATGHVCARKSMNSAPAASPTSRAPADRENRILISADTGFGELLTNVPVLAPSVTLPRRARPTSRISRANWPRQPRTGRRRPGRRRADRTSDTRIRTRRLPVNPPTED